ncbi:MAG: FAD-dependent oxidoreductase, partial [Thiohalorhabdaceae bacterium]
MAIIGSGSGAFAAAIRAAEREARVTLIEEAEGIGGTCVNVGCVPSKIALRAADTAHQAAHHPFAGVPHAQGSVDRAALLRQIQHRVTELRQAKYEGILADNPAISRIQGRARLTDAGAVEVATADGRQCLEPDRILIATGAAPAAPPIPGLAETPWWSSDEALFTDTTPDHLAVIGASFVAVEIAQAFRRLGSAVTILARSRLL